MFSVGMYEQPLVPKRASIVPINIYFLFILFINSPELVITFFNYSILVSNLWYNYIDYFRVRVNYVKV